MLEEIFSSRIGTKLILKIGREAYREFYLYQLSKELKIGLGRTKTLLENLKNKDILISTKKGRTIFYKLNENNRLVYDIIYLAHKDALLKTDGKYLSAITRLSDLYKEELKDNLISVILFGSVAKGKAKKWSDIDILIILKTKPDEEKRKNMMEISSSILDTYANISEEHFFTEKEFEEAYRIGDDFLINVIKEGIILHDKGYFARYAIRGIPSITRKSIEKRLDFAKQWLDSALELYSKYPESVTSSIGTISIHLARAWLLLNNILPGSKHEIPQQLLSIKEAKFSRIYKTSREWFDSPPLKAEKQKIWQMLMFLKEKYNECRKKLEGWA